MTIKIATKSKQTKSSLAAALGGLLLICINAPAIALDAPAIEQDEALPSEVRVVGRKYFRVMEAEIREAEDHMYALYNQINKDSLYDVTCGWEQEIGTRIPQRMCRPSFVKKATRSEAQAYFFQVANTNNDYHTAGVHAPSVQSALAHHYPILREKMEAALTENKEFLDAVIHHYELRENLKARKSSIFGLSEDS